MPKKILSVALIVIALVTSSQLVLAKPLAKGEHFKDATITHRNTNVGHSHPSTNLQTNPSNANRTNTGGSGGKRK
jgi:hypothetical protein